MHVDSSTTGYYFKAQLDRAVTHRVLCARFEWYGPPSTDDPKQCKLLGSNLFLWERIFEKMEETFRFGDPLHANNDRLDHVMIYLFDGRDGSPKFHAHLWKPSMGRDLMSVGYSDAEDTNPYLPYVMEALQAQREAVKVSTVVEQAFAKVRKAKVARLPQYLPLEAHKVFLRDTLMRLRHTDPFIYFKGSNRIGQPHIDLIVTNMERRFRAVTWSARCRSARHARAKAATRS